MEFEMHYLQLSNLVRYHFIKKEVVPFINAGIANGFAIKGYNTTIVEEHYHQATKITEVPALQDMRNYEQSWIVGVGLKYKQFGGEIRASREVMLYRPIQD